MKPSRIALFIGRFQPLHNGHLAVIKRLAQQSTLLKIGIGSSQYSNTTDNPLSGEERKAMLHGVLKAEHITNARIFLIPDVHDDNTWVYHVQKIVGSFDITYSGNRSVIVPFKKASLPIKRIREIDPYEATKIRRLVALQKPMANLVPEPVLDYLKKINAFERIRSLNSM